MAAQTFTDNFLTNASVVSIAELISYYSPFAAVFSLPLQISDALPGRGSQVMVFWGFLGFVLVYNLALLFGMMWLF